MKPRLDYAILTIAIIVPFGLVALGLWKAYDIIKKEKAIEESNSSK